MSRQVIEERLIKLGIDNEQFKRGLKESLMSLEDLDKSLIKADSKSSFSNTEKSTRSLSKSLGDLMSNAPKIGNVFLGMFDKVGASLNKTSDGISYLASSALRFITPISIGSNNVSKSLERMNESVQQSGQNFGFLQSVATVALGNIAASAVQTGLSIASNLGRKVMDSIMPLKQGFHQFEDKINSVNMLVAALGKSEMGNITESLDDLQKYAETTKYSVKQMHSSLAQFVNAGVGLKDSATALKGWGNLAASAGATADGFNRSLQFGVQQALQMGKMTTQNWMSVENAGMATKRFKDILTQTAKEMGKNVDMSEGFRESLQKGWLTNDVLVKSLEKLAKDETLVKMASEFHTLGEVSEAISDQVTSSWSRFWETMIGQAGSDEVTAFWTKWGNLASEALSKAGEKATEFAQYFVGLGGRTKIIQLMEIALTSLRLVLKPISESFKRVFGDGTNVRFADKLIKAIETLTNRFRIGASESEAFRRIFQAIFETARLIFAELGAKLKLIELLIPDHIFKDFLMFLGMLANATTGVIRSIEVIINKFVDFKKVGSTFKSVSDSIHGFWNNMFENVAKFTYYWGNLFEKMPANVGKAIDWLKKLWHVITLLTPAIGEFKRNFREVISNITNPFKYLGEALGDNSKKFNEWSFWVGNAFKRFPLFGKQIGEFIVGFSRFTKASDRMPTIAGRLGNSLRGALNKIMEDWSTSFGELKFRYKAFWLQFNSNMNKVLKGQIRTWKDFNKNLDYTDLLPNNIANMFSGIKFKLPDFSKVKSGLAGFATNPFQAISDGSAGLSKWLQNSTFSFQSLGNVIRKTWPSLGDYADKIDKVKLSLSFLQPIVDVIGKSIDWLIRKLSGFSIGNFKFSDLTEGFAQVKNTLNTNFADGLVPGIVKSIDAFREWASELDVVKTSINGLLAGKSLVYEFVDNIKKNFMKSKVDFTNYKTTLKTFANWNTAFWQSLADTANGPTLQRVTKGFKDIFSGIIKWFKSTFGPWFIRFFGSLPDDVQKALLNIWSAIKKFGSEFASNFKDVDFSFKHFGESVKDIGKGIVKIFDKVVESLKKIWEGFKSLFKVTSASADELTPGDFGRSDMEKAKEGIDNLSDDVDHLHGKTQNMFTTIGDMAKLMAKMFSEGLKPFTKENSESIGRILTLAAAITVLWNTRKKVLGFRDMFKDFTHSLISGPKTVIGSLTGMMNAIGSTFKAKSRIENIKAMSLAIATLVGSLWLLSSIPKDKLLTGIGGLTAVLLVFEVFYLTLSKTTKKFNPARVSNMQKAMLGMLGLSGSILMLSASVSLLGNMNWQKGLQGIAGVSLLLGAMFVSMGIMNKLQSNTVRGTQKIAVSLLTFVGMAYTINKIVPSIAKLGSLPISTLLKGIHGLGAIILGMSAVILATSKMKGTKFASIFAFTAMATAIRKLADTISNLGSMDTGKLLQGGIAVTALLGVMAYMAKSFGALDNSKQSFSKNAFVMFAGLAVLFKMMSDFAKSLSSMPNPTTFAVAIGGMAVVIGLFAFLAFKLNSLDKGISKGLTRLGVIITEFLVAAYGMSVLSKMNSNLASVSVSILSLAAVVSGFIGLAYLGASVPLQGLAAIAIASASVVIAGEGLKKIANIPVDNILKKILTFGAIIGSLVGIGFLLSKAPIAMVGIGVVALSILAIGAAVEKTTSGIANFIRSITELLSTTARLGAEGGNGVAKFFTEAAKGADGMTKIMAAAASGMIAGFVEGVEKNIVRIGGVAVRLIEAFITGLMSSAFRIGGALLTIVANAVTGLIDAIPTFVLRLCETILNGITQIAQWIRNNKSLIVSAVAEVIESIIEIVSEGLRLVINVILGALSNIPGIGGEIKKFIPEVNNAFKALNKEMRSGLDGFKDYPTIATESGIRKAIAKMEELGPEEAEAARKFAAKGKDGLESFRIYCSQLGIQGPKEFINGLKNGSISAQEAGKLLAKMAELGMSDSQIKQIAEAAGYSYADGVLVAKEKAKENAGQVKKSVEEGLSGDGNGFDTGLVTAAFSKLNAHLGGKLDITKALAGLKSGEINQEMLAKLASGDFSQVSQTNMDNYLKPVNEVGDKAATAIDDANAKMGTSLGNFAANFVGKATETSDSVNFTLGNLKPSVDSAEKHMSDYADVIKNGKTNSEKSAKIVSDAAKGSLEFDGGSPADTSVNSFANGIKSEGSKSKAASAAKEVSRHASSNMNDTSGAAASGEAITREFAAGLASAGALAAVALSMQKVNAQVKSHQPHSPAKKGLFSGRGWTDVFKSGLAITKEFASGLGSTGGLSTISSNMDKVNDFVKSAMDKMTGYLDDNMDLNPTITPVLDMSNLENYSWAGNGLLNLSTNGVNYASLNPTTQAQSTSRYSIDEVVKGLNALDRKLETLTEVGTTGNELLAQDRISPVYMDKDLVNKALAPGMSNAQHSYNDRINMLDGVLPTI